ncbi:aminotransferase class I/II-fold pyridoxal phosphate-dependent enzyme [Spirillospora sp. NBC_00431]
MNAGEPGPIGPQVDRFREPSEREPREPREPSELAEILGDWMSGPGPLYRKLAGALQRAVRDGSLDPGERLPSERVLAKALVVSRATVVTAYDELRGLGIVDSRRGSGTRVVRQPGSSRPGADGRVPGGRAASIIQRLIDGPGDVISLRHAMEGAVPELGTELAALLAEDLPALMRDTGYHPNGLPALRQGVAARLTAAGLRTDPENVLVTTGVTQALALAAQMYLRRRSIVVVESPGWPGCFDVFRAAGARLVGVPLDDDGIRVDELARAFAEHRPDLLYVMPTVHNPTGTLMSEGRRRRVAEIAAEHRVPILEDNAYDIGGASRPPPIAAFAPRGAEVLSADSLAKSVWGGLRTGWVRAPAETIERLARHKALADLAAPSSTRRSPPGCYPASRRSPPPAAPSCATASTTSPPSWPSGCRSGVSSGRRAGRPSGSSCPDATRAPSPRWRCGTASRSSRAPPWTRPAPTTASCGCRTRSPPTS